MLAQRPGAVVVRGIVGAGLGADLAEAVHADVIAPREGVDDVRRVEAARVGRVGRVGEDRDGRRARGRTGRGRRRQRGQAARVVVAEGDGEVEVDRVVERPLLHVGRIMLPQAQPGAEVDALAGRVLRVLVAGVGDGPSDGADVAGREDADGGRVVVQGEADLLEVVDALRCAGRPRGPPARPAAAGRSGRR